MDMLVEWQGKGATLRTGIDVADAIVRITPGGSWTLADAHRFFETQNLINQAARSRYGVLKIVMDLRGGQVLPREVAEQFEVSSRTLYRPCDHIAVVVHSMLLRLQLKRAFNSGVVEIFTSQEDAEAWLTARLRERAGTA